MLVSPGLNCTTPVLLVRPPSVVYVNCIAPPGPLGRTLKIAVYVTVSCVPQDLPETERGSN